MPLFGIQGLLQSDLNLSRVLVMASFVQAVFGILRDQFLEGSVWAYHAW